MSDDVTNNKARGNYLFINRKKCYQWVILTSFRFTFCTTIFTNMDICLLYLAGLFMMLDIIFYISEITKLTFHIRCRVIMLLKKGPIANCMSKKCELLRK